jgi:polyferredoxin
MERLMGKIRLVNNRLLKPFTSLFAEWRYLLLLSLVILVLSLTLSGWLPPFQRAEVALSVSIDEESKVQIHIVDLPLGVIPIDLPIISFPTPGKHIVWMTVLVVPNLAVNMVPWITYASMLLWMRKKRMLPKSPTNLTPKA